MDAIHTVSEAQ
jgi:dynein heavy chain